MSFNCKLFAIALVLAAGSPVAAQEEQDTVDLMQAATRSPALAAVLEGLVWPLPVGHWYAGDMKRGLLPKAVELGGIPLMLMCADIIGTADCSDTQETVSGLGAVMFLGGWVWGMVSAYRTASDRNEAIRTRFGSVEVSYGIRPTTSRFEFGATLHLRQ